MGISCSFVHELPNGRQDGSTLALDNIDRISSVYMKNGVKHGTNACWAITPDGYGIYLLYMGTNIDGMVHGDFTQWYASGAVWVRGYYLDGIQHGKYNIWDPNGVLTSCHEYDMWRVLPSSMNA